MKALGDEWWWWWWWWWRIFGEWNSLGGGRVRLPPPHHHLLLSVSYYYYFTHTLSLCLSVSLCLSLVFPSLPGSRRWYSSGRGFTGFPKQSLDPSASQLDVCVYMYSVVVVRESHGTTSEAWNFTVVLSATCITCAVHLQ
ncbi:uncharacterized protein BP01DRAFT_23863 [Aspergillus saccharolyticus JOP 1030-1]|uniref:Uncharacterized protein n=1 Tax=Aspergillus saccharolyticus JOP 1030-1 TaxID=1450539 RepID=A0A318ZHA7_9EURO|nr:hypothetical protein BP01DRAFT_23863 [Aspergillus saccharolyticus JOP 1030-1]PYH46137.1 hypothetical protein BP01DRAFT_23863 [Aspergillus saccharolyticus JOP 1030-1]